MLGKRLLFPLVAAVAAGSASAQMIPHVTAKIVSSSDGYTPGHPVEVAVKLTMDKGWHVYWVNPGDAGMPVSVEWTLPEGWVAGPLLHPVPIAFDAAGIAGYGYEKEVVLPCYLTPAEEGSGDVEIGAKVAWLGCDAAACVPGEAEVNVSLAEGAAHPTPEAEAIAETLERVPEPVSGAKLTVAEADDRLALELLLPAGIDPTGCDVFPVTKSTINQNEPVAFEKDGAVWRAKVKRHEYAPDEVSELELVLAGGKLSGPLLVSWKAGE